MPLPLPLITRGQHNRAFGRAWPQIEEAMGFHADDMHEVVACWHFPLGFVLTACIATAIGWAIALPLGLYSTPGPRAIIAFLAGLVAAESVLLLLRRRYVLAWELDDIARVGFARVGQFTYRLRSVVFVEVPHGLAVALIARGMRAQTFEVRQGDRTWRLRTGSGARPRLEALQRATSRDPRVTES